MRTHRLEIFLFLLILICAVLALWAIFFHRGFEPNAISVALIGTSIVAHLLIGAYRLRVWIGDHAFKSREPTDQPPEDSP